MPASDATWQPEMKCAFPGPDCYALMLLLKEINYIYLHIYIYLIQKSVLCVQAKPPQRPLPAVPEKSTPPALPPVRRKETRQDSTDEEYIEPSTEPIQEPSRKVVLLSLFSLQTVCDVNPNIFCSGGGAANFIGRQIDRLTRYPHPSIFIGGFAPTPPPPRSTPLRLVQNDRLHECFTFCKKKSVRY